jgi:Spy/CpxP family protein refolding chaperone
MDQQLSLSDDQWQIIEHLLQRERSELPVEIHHARTSAVKDELRQRLRNVDHLIERVHTVSQPAAGTQ